MNNVSWFACLPTRIISVTNWNRFLWRLIWLAASFGLVAAACGTWEIAAAQSKTATTTTLAVTSGTSSSAVTTVSSGSVVTLTATVTAGSTPLTVGQVSFCDASAKSCTDIHLHGLGQLTSAGTAVMKFRPGPGSHQYKAVFAGATKYAGSTSATASLDVTGPTRSTTTLTAGGDPGNYDLTATVYGTGSTAPSGNVSFLDTSKGNGVLATATLSAGPSGLYFPMLPNAPMTYYSPFDIAIADFNGDGIEDLAISSLGISFLGSPTLAILLGKADGTFTYASSTNIAPGGPNPSPFGVMGMGDFNRDGILDIAVTDSSNNLIVLLGKGDGTFTTSKQSPVLGNRPASGAVGDFNSDGILDLAVANAGSNDITVLLGNGDGTFTPAATSLQTGSSPFIIATADFNQDGIPDLAVLYNNNGQSTVAIYLGNGAGGFTLVTAGPGTGTAANELTVCDVNGDGVPDLVVVNWVITNPGISQTTTITASVLIGNGDGTFKAGSQVSFDSPSLGAAEAVIVGDFNGDGNPDLAIATSSPPGYVQPTESVTILLGDGSGGFTNPGVSVGIGDGLGEPVAVGDLNGDGISDIASTSEPCIGACQGLMNILLASDQSAAATANGVWLPLATDTAQVVVSYGGDSNYQPSVSSPVSLFSGAGTPTVTVKASSNPVSYGTAETLTAQVSGTGFMPTGRVTFYDGSGPLGVNTLSGGAATYVSSTFTVGSHPISVIYSGDANYTAGTSAVLALKVLKGPPTINLTLSSSSILNTQALNVAITVSGAAGSSIPQGTEILSSGSYTSAAATLSNGAATINVPAGSLGIGTDTLTVTYTPSSASSGSYTSATQSATVTVNKIGSATATITVSPSAAVITDQQSINVNVTVAGAQGMATPTGSIQLASGAYSAQIAVSSGAATIAIPAGTLSAGADTLTATYSGDATYAAASGTATVTVSPVVMGATAPSPITAGGSATAKVTLTAGSSYSGTLNISCALTTSPANAQSPPTCALNPSTTTIAAGGNATTTLTVNTTAGMSAMLMRSKDRLWGKGTEAATFAALLIMGLRVRRRRWMCILALLVMITSVVAGGCGGGSHSTSQSTPPTTAGTYVFAVKATDSKNATIATTVNVSVTVQ